MTDAKPEEAAPTVQPTDVIAGKYRIEGVLGTGGMGVVLAATQLDLDRLVAVKVMRAELAEYPGAVQRLLLEAKLAAQFRSEHVCKVLDVGTLPDGVPYIVMEYLEGSDLATLLSKQGALDIATAVDFVLEACEALAEAHNAHIVHRDLKPENLFVTKLLDGTPTIKVLDFGISKQIGASATARALTNPSAALGSPYYMAPEQMRAAKDVDLRADIWALGAILFELLTGRQAFEGDTLPEICAAVISAQPRRVSELRGEVPTPLSHAVDRCLRKDPNERFANVAQLASEIAPFGSSRARASLRRISRVLAGSGGVVRPAETVDTAATLVLMGAAARRRRMWVATAGLGALLGVGLMLLLSAAGHDAPASSASAVPPSAVAAALAPPPASHDQQGMPSAAPLAVDAAAVPVAPAAAREGGAAALPAPRVRRPRVRDGAPTPVAAAPAQSPKDPKDNGHKATEAWDPTSFGPRR